MSANLQPLLTLASIGAEIPKGKTPLVTEVTSQLNEVTSTLFAKNFDMVAADTGSVFDDIIGAIEKAINNAIKGVKDLVNNVATTITNTVNNQIKNLQTALSAVATQITNKIDSAIGGLEAALNDAIGWITEKLQGLIDAVSNIAGTIADAISNAISDIGDYIANAVNGALASIGSWISGAIRDVGNWIKGIYDAVSRWISNAIDDVGGWIKDSQDAVANWINGVINTLKQTYESTKKSVEDWINQVFTWIRGVRDQIVKWFNESVLPVLGENVKGFLGMLLILSDWAKDVTGLSNEDIDKVLHGDLSPLSKAMDNMGTDVGQLLQKSPIFALAKGIAFMYNQIELEFVPSKVAAQKYAEIGLQLDPTSLDAAALAVYRGVLSLDKYYDNAKLAGISKDRADINLAANRQLPTPGAIQEAFLRGTIDEKTHDRLLHSYGYTDDHISLLRALYHLIPSPSDLIRMGVREAFTPEIAEKFGQYEDFPPAFGEWAEKIGIDLDWAKRYWAAHWDLPSASMGFEMLHRGVIDDNELKLLLRALDVMPYWRERLVAISYNPLTRVDIRRMYQNGVLNEDQVKRAYLDLGYNDEKAGWLTDFTKRYYTPEDQTQLDQFHDLARTTYSQAYRRKIISREEYRTYLEALKYFKDDIELLITLDDYAIANDDKLFDLNSYRNTYKKLALNAYDDGLIGVDDLSMILADLGYEEDEISLELALSEYNRSLATRNVLLGQLHDQYVTFIIDNVQLAEIMGMYNFTDQEVNNLLETWNIERSFRTKRPSLADLKKFLDKGILTFDQYLDELRGSGYNEKYIGMYATMLAAPTG